MKKVLLRSGAWYGDHTSTLTFPEEWDVNIIGDRILPELDIHALRRAICSPISSPPLRELAENKKNVAVIIDDITRPTPSDQILPLILDELQKGGVPPTSVTVLVAGGTHRPATDEEIRKKLGPLSTSIRVHSHDCKNDLEYLGRSSQNNPIHVSHAVMQCDLKIAIGCLYPHKIAGFSGGGKIIMPGLCGLDTIRNAHASLQCASHRGDMTHTAFRQEVEDVVRMTGLDFIVNAAMNQERKIAGLFTGDPIAAHAEGAEAVKQLYMHPTAEKPDIVVADTYPFDISMTVAHTRGLWPIKEIHPEATAVILAACPMGMGSHELYSLTTPKSKKSMNHLQRLLTYDLRRLPKRLKRAKQELRSTTRPIMALTGALQTDELRQLFPRAQCYPTWSDLLPNLETHHRKGPVTVAIYRCAPLILPEPPRT